MKKFYLSVAQRRRIINMALKDASNIESTLKEKKLEPGAVSDLLEETIQELRSLAALLKVEDFEED